MREESLVRKMLDMLRQMERLLPLNTSPSEDKPSCYVCRVSYTPTSWDTDKDRERKKNGPPCDTCDRPEEERNSVPKREKEHFNPDQLMERAEVVGTAKDPLRKFTVFQLVDGKIVRTEVQGNNLILWEDGTQFIVAQKLVIAAPGKNDRGRLVFAAPTASVISVVEGWEETIGAFRHNIEPMGTRLLATNGGVEDVQGQS